MTRSIAGALLTDLAVQGGVETAQLVEFQFGSGTQRVTDAPRSLSWNAQTWTALGGAMAVAPVAEGADDGAQGVEISLAGVDQTLLALILGETYRGRLCTIYSGHWSQTTGLVIGTPLTLFVGYMNERWVVKERRPREGAGAIEITTRLVSRVSALRQKRGVRCNVDSHRAAIPAAAAAGDTFFQNVSNLPGKSIIWGGAHRDVFTGRWIYD